MGVRGMAPLLLVAALWAPTTGCSIARPPVTRPAPAHELPAAHAPEPAPTPQLAATDPDVPAGVFHRVEPGQTLWRIARAYGVGLDQLRSANDVSDPTALVAGSMLFVPGANMLLDIPAYPAPAPMPAPIEAAEVPEPPAADGFVWPVAGGEVLSRFGAPRRGRKHAGIDIRGPLGQEILATESGEVVYSGAKFSGYGKMVILDHGSGLESVYAHASDLLVSLGDHVQRGQPVARVGRTGNATTEHCHFELRENKIPFDPLTRYPEIARQLAGTDQEKFVAAERKPTSRAAH